MRDSAADARWLLLTTIAVPVLLGSRTCQFGVGDEFENAARIAVQGEGVNENHAVQVFFGGFDLGHCFGKTRGDERVLGGFESVSGDYRE